MLANPVEIDCVTRHLHEFDQDIYVEVPNNNRYGTTVPSSGTAWSFFLGIVSSVHRLRMGGGI